MYVVGVAGQAQMGKDTVADQLALKLNEKISKGYNIPFVNPNGL